MVDAVIIGGGMQGCTLALAAAERGLRPVIVERGELGSGATGHSYGIVHGGLRYLQTMDVARWARSRRAQAWFVRTFPEHVRPLRCAMPLYRGRLRSPAMFAAAHMLERAMAGVAGATGLPLEPSRASADEIARSYAIPRKGLVGAAIWHDARIDDFNAFFRSLARRAERMGAIFLTGQEACVLELDAQSRVAGVSMRAVKTGALRTIEARTVIDCAGSDVGALLPAQLRGRFPRAWMLAFNMVMDIPVPAAGAAFALSPDPGRGRSYFFREHDGRCLVGTFYRACARGGSVVTEADIVEALFQVRRCLPAFGIERKHVISVSSGLLPGRSGKEERFDLRDHVLQPGPAGYYVVTGGKFTTAPVLSQDVARQLWPDVPGRKVQRQIVGHA